MKIQDNSICYYTKFIQEYLSKLEHCLDIGYREKLEKSKLKDKYIGDENNGEFFSLFWEIYFCYLMKKFNPEIIIRRFCEKKQGNIGPDFQLNVNGVSILAEAVSPRNSETLDDKIPENECILSKKIEPIITPFDPKKIHLRILNSISNKVDGYLKYLKNKIINQDQIFILVISLRSLPTNEIGKFLHTPLGDLNVLSSFFPINNSIEVKFIRDLISGKIRMVGHEIPKNNYILKSNNNLVPKLGFLDHKNACISAVLISWGAYFSEEQDNDFVLIHNPLAKNPLPEKFFNVENEYIWNLNVSEIKKIC